MKRSRSLLVILLLLISNCAFTQTGNGRIYFMRSTGFQGSAAGFTAFIDGEFVCKLNNKKFSMHVVPAGSHVVSVQFAGKKAKDKAEPITLTVEPDKSYYIQFVFQSGFFVNNVYCSEITENSARPLMEGLEEDLNCK
jgi:Protein of unknown function (DUF2846)